MDFSRLDAICQEAEREAPKVKPPKAAATPSLDDFMKMFDEEDAQRSERPLQSDMIVLNSEEVAKTESLPQGLWEDEDGDVAHGFLEEAAADMVEVPKSKLRPAGEDAQPAAPATSSPPLVPSPPAAPAPEAVRSARRGRGFTAAVAARPSDSQGGLLAKQEGDEKMSHDLDVLEGKVRPEKHAEAAPKLQSMEELLSQLDQDEGGKPESSRPSRPAISPAQAAASGASGASNLLNGFGQQRQDAEAHAKAERQRQQVAEREMLDRLQGERHRVERRQGEDEDANDLKERLARLRARQADDWEKEEEVTVAVQSSQAKFEEERRRIKEARRRAKGGEPATFEQEKAKAEEEARKHAHQDQQSAAPTVPPAPSAESAPPDAPKGRPRGAGFSAMMQPEGERRPAVQVESHEVAAQEPAAAPAEVPPAASPQVEEHEELEALKSKSQNGGSAEAAQEEAKLLREKLAEVEAQHAAATRAAEELRQQLADEASASQKEMEGLRAEAAQVHELKDQLAAVEAQTAAQSAAADQQRQEMSTQVQQLNQKIADMLTEMQAESSSSDAAAEQHREEVETLKAEAAQVEELKAKLAEVQAQSSSSDAAAEQQRQEMEALRAEAAQAQQLKDKLAEVEAQHASATTAAEQHRQELETLKSQSSAEVQQLQQKLAETQAQSSSSDAAAEQQRQEMEALRAEAAQVQQLKDKLAEVKEPLERTQEIQEATSISAAMSGPKVVEDTPAPEPHQDAAISPAMQEAPAPRRRRKGFSSALEALPVPQEKVEAVPSVEEKAEAVPSMEELLSMLDGE